MAFLGRALMCLAEELGETVMEEMKVPALKKLIVASKEYEEVFAKELLHRIERNSQNEGIQEHVPVGLQKLMRTFDPKEGDISFYLILFERQARRVHIKEDWVTNLVVLLPLEMANLIAREPEEKANDYEHIKGMLLKRFKLSPEAFKVKFKRYCKSAENTWRDFGFELANYFNEWISGLKIYDFDRLKQLVEQMKEHVSRDIQQHFIDNWSRIVTVDDLTKKDKKDGRGKTEDKVAEVKVSEVQVAEVKVVEDESKVVTARFNGEVVRENKKCSAVQLKMSDLKIVKISYGGTEYEAVVDSGAQISVFKSSVMGKEVDYKGHIMLQPAFGDCLKAELKEVDIGLVKNGYITPVIKAVVATVDGLNTDILLDTETYEALLEQGRIYSPRFTAAMNLRSDSSKKSLDESVKTEDEEQEPTITEYDEENGNNTEKFKKQQQICDTLQEAWNFARRNKGVYVIENILYHEELLGGNRIKQLVIPEMRKRKILEIAHKSVFGAHLGAHKTIQGIKFSFYWPGMVKEIRAYCHGCQLRKVIRSVDKIPITPVSRPELPFQVVNGDLIGPVDPVSSQGHKYILCLMDQYSRWPEAIPLKSLMAKSMCEALLEIFSRTGIPEVIVMDNATNFTASLMQEFLKILGACPRFSTPYHPKGNGLIERWNQTLKNMLHHIIREEGRSWHRHIPFLLWGYREVPNAITGTPPFLLMYERDPNRPLSILKSIWTGNTLLPLNMKGLVESYLKKLKEKLEVATHKAKLTSDVQQGSYAKYYNRQKKHREFAPGDQLLVLIPDSMNKLYARWTGPVKVVKRVKPN
ncbi:retrovirus-related Pol polyprotein from transposon 412 [Trichonephila clavipes]|nr:retrovirus-related Pol polyprotein from transposon 412 [Trichonephila clavipes]